MRRSLSDFRTLKKACQPLRELEQLKNKMAAGSSRLLLLHTLRRLAMHVSLSSLLLRKAALLSAARVTQAATHLCVDNIMYLLAQAQPT